jgi:phage terminase small subunit
MAIKMTEEQIEIASKLTQLQRKTVINIMSGMSNRQAYIKAGGKAKSEHSADQVVSKMLINAKVKKFYNSLLASATEKALLSKEEAIKILEAAATIKITDVCDFRNKRIGEDEKGNPVYQTVWTVKDAENIPDRIARCIKSVEVTSKGPKIEVYDSHGAIKQLSAMQGWDAPKKTELTGSEGKPLEVKSEISAPEITKALDDLMEKL